MNAAALRNDGDRATRPAATRVRNGRIAESARRHRFDGQTPVPFICECSDARCEALLRMTLRDYASARSGGDYLVAPGHQVDEARLVRIKELCWLYRDEPAA